MRGNESQVIGSHSKTGEGENRGKMREQLERRNQKRAKQGNGWPGSIYCTGARWGYKYIRRREKACLPRKEERGGGKKQPDVANVLKAATRSSVVRCAQVARRASSKAGSGSRKVGDRV